MTHDPAAAVAAPCMLTRRPGCPKFASRDTVVKTALHAALEATRVAVRRLLPLVKPALPTSVLLVCERVWLPASVSL